MILYNDDCLLILQKLHDNSIDSIVTDPPYGIKLLGKDWDYNLPDIRIWEECLRVLKPGGYLLSFSSSRTFHRLAVAVEDAGFDIRDQIMWVYGSGMPKGQNLKPAHEPIVVAKKPHRGSLKNNVEEYGTGYIQVQDCKVGGRWPANLIHDGSDVIVEAFPEKAGALFSATRKVATTGGSGNSLMGTARQVGEGNGAIDEPGSAARFFYCAKPTRTERRENPHPTVKPLKLMDYLCRLVTPPGGLVLDPFMGSGTTGAAALTAGYDFYGIEQDLDYFQIAKDRISHLQVD